jgi:hypothetical protein
MRISVFGIIHFEVQISPFEIIIKNQNSIIYFLAFDFPKSVFYSLIFT